MIYKNCFFYKQKNVNLMGQLTHKSILNNLLITIKKNTLSKLSVRFVTITEKEFVLLPKVNQEPKSRYCFHLLLNKKTAIMDYANAFSTKLEYYQFYIYNL